MLMGKVIAKQVLLKNHRDEIAVDLGVLESEKVRKARRDMIVDTGAVAVSLPASLIDQLGLPVEREVLVTRSDGTKITVALHNDLSVTINDRRALTQCLAKPEDYPLLLGQLVLEQIDYIVDCKNQKMIPNPEEQDGMILYDDF